MNAILTSKRYMPTAQRLGDALNIPVHKRAMSKVEHYINWGYWESTSHHSVFPHPHRVSRASSKVDFKRRLVEAGLWTRPYGVVGPGHRVPEKFPVVARYPRHTMGRGFAFCKSLGEFARLPKEFSYWTEYIDDPKRTEYRIHITCDGTVLARRRKFRKGTVTDPMQDIVRNYRNGWRYALLKTAKPVVVRAARETAEMYARSYSLHGNIPLAVDIIESNDVAEVLEVNLFPGLSYQPILDIYVKHFAEYLGNVPVDEPLPAPAVEWQFTNASTSEWSEGEGAFDEPDMPAEERF